VDSLPPAIRHDVFVAIAHAVQGVFYWALPASVLVFLLAWLIKEVPLRGRNTPAAEQPAPHPEMVA
jgi:hypothetical protein